MSGKTTAERLGRSRLFMSGVLDRLLINSAGRAPSVSDPHQCDSSLKKLEAMHAPVSFFRLFDGEGPLKILCDIEKVYFPIAPGTMVFE
jgi:hypothetical protein